MTRVICAVFLIALGTSRGSLAQEKPDPREFAKLGVPGPEHERLKPLIGAWTLTLEGGKKEGRAEYKSILGGRFVTEGVRLPFGEAITFKWLGIYGYDRYKKKYTAVWVDNFDTTTESGEGDADATGKIITFRGEHHDPRIGKTAPFRWRLTVDGEKLTIEMFEVDAAGKEKLALSVKGTRAN